MNKIISFEDAAFSFDTSVEKFRSVLKFMEIEPLRTPQDQEYFDAELYLELRLRFDAFRRKASPFFSDEFKIDV